MLLKKIGELLLAAPAIRALINVIFPILSGLFSGIFTAQIAGKDGLVWGQFYQAWALYPLVITVLILFFYTRALYKRETHILNFADADFCVAYMRSKCLPEAAEKYKELIREGKGGELMKVMSELKKSLK